jgi:sorbitol/mannitol transport system substrate-binding protein
MIDLQKLTADHFTKDTGISVNYTVLPENDVRDKISQEFSSQAAQYDVASLSNFEIPIYAKAGWISPLDGFIAKDAAFDQGDILEPMQVSLSSEGKVYGEPFYGESSFLMYRKDIMKKKNIDVPARPTWPQVAKIAAKVDGAEPGMKGICLRGLPGWGEVFAPLTTVVNTYGGTWFDKDWNAQVNAQPFKDATTFYTDLVKAHGEAGAAQAGFAECLTATTQSKVAMWYDATSAAGSLEAPDSPVKGKMAYVQAPVKETKSAGWLYAWSWAIEKKSQKADNAWKFISWASSQKYEELVGAQDGWATVPAGKRESTYKNAEYVKAAEAFAEPTRKAIESADPTNPGVQPRPTVGIQFVDIPEFTDFATKISQDVSSVIAGKKSVDEALDNGQKLAQAAGDKYKGK